MPTLLVIKKKPTKNMPIDFESCHVDCEHHSHKRNCCSVGAFHHLRSGEDLKIFADELQ